MQNITRPMKRSSNSDSQEKGPFVTPNEKEGHGKRQKK
jgi:hypothetical protein